SAGARDDANATREPWQRPLARGIEEAFRLELLAAALELGLQRAHPGGLDEVDDELQLAARLVHGDAAVRDDQRAVLQLATVGEVVAAEEGATQRRVLLLKSEVDVAGGVERKVAHLSLNPQVTEVGIGLDAVAEVTRDLEDAVRARLHGARAARVPR